MGTLRGRIAQLVELLSYTQVVIGSSPVAPIYPLAGVVQSVRALACHARSCGFESRLSRNKALLTKAPFFISIHIFYCTIHYQILILIKKLGSGRGI